MIAFLDATTYYFGFLILVIGFIVIFRFKKSILFTYRTPVALFLAVVQMIIFLINSITPIIQEDWWRVLLHDLCPLVSFVSIIVFIIDRNNIYKPLIPWLLIGSVVTIFTGSAPFWSAPWSLMTFFEHMTMLLQGLLAYIWVNKYHGKDFFMILILPAFLVVWNFLTGFLPWKITNNNDWVIVSNGMFWPSTAPGQNFEILGMFPFIPDPLPLIIFYALAVGVAYLICLNKNYSAKLKKIFKLSK